jgi:putative ABC transport system permease protein
MSMIKNYLRVGWRNLLRNKSYVIINTFGLGIALACCITAYLLIAFNIEFDNFHKADKVAKIFKIHTHFLEKDGRKTQSVTAPLVMPPFAASEIAGVERYTRFIYNGGYMRHGDNAFSEGISFADSTFFDMFDFPLVAGSHKSFKNKHSIFLSEAYAKKYFGEEDPIGKIITLNFPNDYNMEATVGGVLKKIPANTSFVFDVMMRIENFSDLNQIAVDKWDDWRDPSTFVELASPENAASISKQFNKYIPVRNEAKKDVVVESYQLEPFKAKFTQDDINSSYANLRISFVPLLVFVTLAVIILLIACFNLTNTSIALTSKRLKEVGVRKAIGAAQSQIISQFLLETVITITLALIVGVILAQFIVPAFVTMWNLPYGLKDLDGVNLFVTLIILVFLASLLAGMYPAIFNSRFKPVALLKGDVRIKGTNGLTRSLVAIQFALSAVVLIAGVIFIQNNNFQEQVNFGYDNERVLAIQIQSENDYETMRDALARNPKILSMGVSDHHVGNNNYEYPVLIDTTEYRSRLVGVGENYFETMGFTLAQGRFLNLDNASDMEEGLIVNEAFVEKLNLDEPIDKIISVHEKKRHIVGVIKNHVDNLFRSKEAEPFVFYPAEKKYYKNMVVKAEHDDLAGIQKEAEKTWKDLFPGKPFNSQFQDDILLEGTKRTNSNLKNIFIFLTILGGLLSGSGIFSLASLNIAKRTKEIGIRKALGASVANVVMLLNKEFVIILSISVVLGSVAGYFLTKALLDEIYAYHITIQYIWVFLCASAVFVIGIATTTSTILQAARSNPVKTLRSE